MDYILRQLNSQLSKLIYNQTVDFVCCCILTDAKLSGDCKLEYSTYNRYKQVLI